jgi:omega-hydroxy-beta-dihydromenaquinone-9 sulfotransferase
MDPSAAATPPDNLGQIVFVTGASRSGTTLLARMFGNHRDILGLHELHYFGDLVDIESIDAQRSDGELAQKLAWLLARQARDFWADGPDANDRQTANMLVASLPSTEKTAAVAYEYALAYLATTAGKRAACEQTPRNIFYADKLLALYPDARMVHIVRDPRAVLASQKNRWQMRKLGGRNVPWAEVIRLWFNYHPWTMSRLWVRASQAALALEPHPRFRIVRFEDLVENPESLMRDLCDWLGIDFQANMLAVPQWGSSNIQHSSSQQGVSRAMLNQWQQVLSTAEIAVSERQTAAYLERFGYAPISIGGSEPLGTMGLLLKYPLHVLGAVLANPRRVLIQLRALSRR